MLQEVVWETILLQLCTAFFIYVAVNMGMVLGLLPIVGAPLPIMPMGILMMAIMLALELQCLAKSTKTLQ